MTSKHVLAVCPVCGQNFVFKINVEFFRNTQSHFPIPLLVKHCNSSVIVYVDYDFKCRGAEQVHAIIDEKHVIDKDEEMQGNPIDSDFIENLQDDEKVILSCGISYEEHMRENFPDVLDKQVLLKIAKNQEISLSILINELKDLEKIMNKIIERGSILKIIDRYVEKGTINKRLLKDREDLEKIAHIHSEHLSQSNV